MAPGRGQVLSPASRAHTQHTCPCDTTAVAAGLAGSWPHDAPSSHPRSAPPLCTSSACRSRAQGLGASARTSCAAPSSRPTPRPGCRVSSTPTGHGSARGGRHAKGGAGLGAGLGLGLGCSWGWVRVLQKGTRETSITPGAAAVNRGWGGAWNHAHAGRECLKCLVCVLLCVPSSLSFLVLNFELVRSSLAQAAGASTGGRRVNCRKAAGAVAPLWHQDAPQEVSCRERVQGAALVVLGH